MSGEEHNPVILGPDSDENGMGVSPDEGRGTECSSDGQYSGMVEEKTCGGVDEGEGWITVASGRKKKMKERERSEG